MTTMSNRQKAAEVIWDAQASGLGIAKPIDLAEALEEEGLLADDLHANRKTTTMSNQFLSTTEMESIAKVADVIHKMNNPGGGPNPDLEGYFAWTYVRSGRTVATASADFPGEVEIKGEKHE